MNKYIMMFVAAIALVSCSDDVLETPSTPVKAGAEVQFGLSLEGTRTVYGEEANNAFPIYWVDGDKVQIYSPECLQGRNAAEYKVSVAKANQNYADSLTPTGDTGIQWGNDETKKANFYSFYPSGAYRLDPTDATQITGVNISTVQTVEYRGTANGKDIIKSNMQDCLMYASAKDVDYGATVNLQYEPITTVLMLKLSVDSNSAENFNVSKITLTAPSTAPSGIVGTFNVDLKTGEFVKFADNTGIKSVVTNIIDSETGGFHTITKGTSFDVPIFIAPVPGLKLEGWKIEVLANNKTFTKTIAADEITYGNGNTGLVAGKIHRITLPTLKTVNTDPGVTDEWLVANWMKNIPRNVYLSEVSIPGSWDTVNGERQSNTTIAGQYSAGVRAFHFDTRWRTNKTSPGFIEGIGGYISGNIDGLSVCGAASSYKFSGISGANRVVAGAAKTFETYLDEIVGKLNQEEYMVLICSFAHDSYDYEGTNGGKWYGEISAICSKDKYASTIADARTITSNTVIGEVLGKLIVIVNMPNEITSTSILPSNSKCLFTCMPANLTSSYYTDTDTNTNSDTTVSLNQKTFWVATTTADGASSSKQTDMIVYNNQTQRTASGNGTSAGDRGYAPSETERTTILNNILTWSKNNYNKDNYAHNMWIYMGLGGYLVNSDGESEKGDDTVASTFNTWINGKVTEMGTTPEGQTAKVPYYPVGIVLMNYVNDYASVVKNILLLNNKYQLQFDPNKPTKTEDYNPNNKARSDYDGSLTNGGNAIQ